MLDCHFVGRRVKSEKPLCPSSLTRPINTVLQLSSRARWSAIRAVIFWLSAIPTRHVATRAEQRAGREAPMPYLRD